MSTTASSNQQQSNESRLTETKYLHFDLSHYPSHDNFTLHAGAIKHQVKRHTCETRALLAKQKGLLGLIQPARLTHYVEAGVELPADTPIMLRLTSARRPEGAKLDTLAIAAIHVPSEARTKALQERWRRETAAGLPMKPYPKLEALGVKAPRPDAPQSDKLDYQKLIIEAEDVNTAFDVATTLISHHPELMSLNKDILAKVQAHIDYLSETSNLANSIYEQAGKHAKDPKHPNWVNSIAGLGPDLKTPDDTRHIYDWSDETKTYAATAIGMALLITKNDPDLENWCYVVQPGTTNVGGTHQPPPAMFAKFNRHTRRTLAAVGAQFTTRDVTPNSGVEYSEVTYDNGKFSIQVTNDWIRWLSLYVEFLGADGSPIEPKDWKSRLPADGSDWENTTKKYLQLCPARRTVLGIPITKSPITIELDWPTNAAGARILCGGLGAHGKWDTLVCLLGTILTGIINFFLVTVFLAAGAVFVWTAGLDAVIAASITALLAVLQLIINGGIASGLTGDNSVPFLIALANAAASILLGSMKAIAAWVAEELGAAWAVNWIPFVGWVCMAIAITANVALLTQTTAEVLSSYFQIELDVNKVMDVTLTVNPDAKSSGGSSWPSQSDHWKATLQYEDGTTWEKTQPLDPKSTAGSIQVAFPAVPAGGRLKAIFVVYSDKDWICGRGETDFLPAPYDAATMAIPPGPDPFCITQLPVPLTVNTQYQFAEKLVVENNVHVWSPAPPASAPTATGPLPHGGGLAQLVGITLSDPTGALGYVWQASGLNLKDCASHEPLRLPFAFQNISVVPAHDQARPSPNCGFAQRPCLLYDLLGPADGKGRNFYFDPRLDANAKTFPNHLRQVVLDGATPFSTAVGKSFGRFNLPMDSLAIHPAGYVVGISTANHKMEVLPLSATPFDDASAPTAVMKGGCGNRPGLFHSPLAVVTTLDGRILVLDQRFQPNFDSLIDTYPARIQALDVNGNPVPCFADGSSKSPQMLLRPEASLVTYLDMGIESKGYIYVLKYVGDASQPANYMLDIYQPDGTFLVQTKGVTAGKMVVSFWRDVYTLNYEQITGPNGPEPSVSKWIPPAPKA
jgi:hypothetical protein